MKEWKIRQALYHKTTMVTDLIENKQTMMCDRSEIVQEVLRYFTQPVEQLIYPAKSYAVAITYAILLQKFFGETIEDVLDDPSLLYYNDQYFVPFSQDQDTYEFLLSKLGELQLLDVEESNLPQVQATVGYFKQEFYIQ